MRRIRPLLLLAILVLLGAVGGVYYVQRGIQLRRAPAVPKPLPPELSATASDWTWSKEVNQRTVVKLSARSFKEVENPSRFQLDGVELQLFSADGGSFDRFKTASAEFDKGRGTLYADGEVEITTGEAAEGQKPGRLVFIRTSGVTYDSRTLRASTDRPATFQFDQGEGKAVGASYDPGSRELLMRSQAEVIWRGNDAGSKTMKVEAGELLYKERESLIALSPWSRLTRGALAMEAGRANAWVEDGAVRRVEADAARGVDRSDQGRQIEYSAEKLYVTLAGNSEVEKITGDRNARLVSLDGSARTTMTADHLELDFELSSGESQLRRALATGHGAVESKPVSGTPPRETRLLRSEIIELQMRSGGREIQSVVTRAPAVLEFIPNQPQQRRRRLEGDRISMAYGANNRLSSLHATNASTRTEPPQTRGKTASSAMLTWSKELEARFTADGREMASLEQWGSFRYEEGDRKGLAERAALDTELNLIALRGGARFWDPGGSVSADRIVMNQENGDVQADGKVASTREPDRSKKPASVLTDSEPMHATSASMFSAGSRRLIRYEGNVVLWQEGNRIEAGWVEIDRNQQTLTARGDVNSQFIEQASGGKGNTAPAYTLIQAPDMVYSDKTRMAQYRGGVVMTQAGVVVRSAELRGILAAKDGGTQLETAYADGKVRIDWSAPGRARTGSGEHAEYYVSQGKVVLYGGAPEFVDNRRGSTRGGQLTWFAEKDRLLVDGREDQPATSRILRKAPP